MFDVLRDTLKIRYGHNRRLYLQALYLNVEVGPKTPDPINGMYALDNYKSGDITLQEALDWVDEKVNYFQFDLDQYQNDWEEYMGLIREEILAWKKSITKDI